MANSTVYDIRLQYILEDKATRPMRKLDAQLAKTSKTASGLGRQFKRLAAGAAGYFGIRAGVKHLIGFNANMEQAKIQMAGMIQLTTKMDQAAAMKESVKLVGALQQKAKASVGTTQDMVEMASMITRPVLAAGMGMEQLGNFTAQAVVASKAFGIEAGMAARDIESALMGQLRSVDRFSRSLLEPLGYVGDEGRKAFNELGAAARAAELEKALGGPAIAAMAKAQATSFSGVLSTFQDTLQMTMGAVGLPLFKEVTAEIKTWNEWISKNGDKVADMGHRIGQGLVTGFRLAKSVLSFMVDHSELLLTIAKTWAAIKIGKKLGGMAETLGQMGGRLARRGGGLQLGLGMDKAGMATAKFGIKLVDVTAKLAAFAPAIGVAAMAFMGIKDWFKGQLPGGVKDEKKRVDALTAAESLIGLKGKISPLLEARLQALGTSALSPFESSRAKVGAAMPRRGISDEQFFQAYEAFTGKKLSTARAATIAPSPSAATRAGQLQMDLNKKRIEELGTEIQASTGSLAQWALEQNLFSNDLKRIREDKLRDLENQIGDNAFAKVNDALGVLERQIKSGSFDLDKWVAAQTAPPAAPPPVDTGKGKKPEFKVTIQRIEVQSDDPSRFVVGLTETVRDAVRNRSAAYDTLVEGS